MSEIYVNVYFRHQDPSTHASLVRLIETGAGQDDASRQGFVDLAAEINADKGEGIAKAFLRDLDDRIHEHFGFDDVDDVAGFCRASATCGGGGDRYAARCVKLLYHLCPGIQAQAWGMGDDDPWEFWLKHEDGHLVRHDAEPFDGYDARIRSTIYRWWHDGLPDVIREGMLNDSDEEDEDQEVGPVTEEQYQQWLKGHEDGSDIADDVEDVVMDELVGAFTNALASMFTGKSAKKTVSADAFDATKLDEDLVRKVFADIDACGKAFDIDGIMKHISQSVKGNVTTTIEGNETTMPMTHSLYRMSLKLVLKEDAEYDGKQEIENIRITDGAAIVGTKSAASYLDPMTNERMESETEDEYTLEVIDGKVQITRIESKELASNPA